ncbi:MAG: hypothetical protein WAO21_13985 [Verrucomicrobiia bacterium]|jgi:hypothetical protein
MIALMSGCLLFRLASGESVPFSAEMISVELVGDAVGKFDPELLSHAAASVFHYFKNELGRETVTVGEFAGALEKALRGLGFNVFSDEPEPRRERREIVEADLLTLARESGESRELFFFPRLRGELRAQLRRTPRLVRFRGLRGCVKQLAGARRWGLRCEKLEEQIVEYLRGCLGAEPEQAHCALVVE